MQGTWTDTPFVQLQSQRSCHVWGGKWHFPANAASIVSSQITPEPAVICTKDTFKLCRRLWKDFPLQCKWSIIFHFSRFTQHCAKIPRRTEDEINFRFLQCPHWLGLRHKQTESKTFRCIQYAHGSADRCEKFVNMKLIVAIEEGEGAEVWVCTTIPSVIQWIISF